MLNKYVMDYLNETYGVDILDTFALGIDLKVHLMSNGVYNDAFDRPQMYTDETAVLKDVVVNMVDMVMEEAEFYNHDDCYDTIEEWADAFDEDTFEAFEATLKGLANDLLKFAKGGKLYQESLQ